QNGQRAGIVARGHSGIVRHGESFRSIGGYGMGSTRIACFLVLMRDATVSWPPPQMWRSHMDAKTSAAVTANNPAFDAYRLLRFTFIVAPIAMGLDKFFNRLTQWPKFLCPLVMNRVPPETFMRITGVVEILAGVLVFLKPKIGAYVVAAWL